MTKEEATHHEKEVLKGDKSPIDLYDQKIVAEIERKLKEEQLYERFR